MKTLSLGLCAVVAGGLFVGCNHHDRRQASRSTTPVEATAAQPTAGEVVVDGDPTCFAAEAPQAVPVE